MDPGGIEERDLMEVSKREARTLADIQPLLAQVLSRLQERFGGDLEAVAVYGSYARARAKAGSDIDFLVVVSRLPREWREVFAIEDELVGWGLDWGTRLDVRLVEPQAVSYAVTCATPLMLEVFDAHHVLFDPRRFFAGEMKRFGRVMQERGIRKIGEGVWRVPSVASQ